MASLKPKLFCGVALWARSFLRAGKRWSCGMNINRGDAYHLRHKYLSNDLIAWWSSNASTPTEPTGRCFLLLQTVSPKRETIRSCFVPVKRHQTARNIRLHGTYCRGGPPWPPVGLERSVEVHSVGLSAINKNPTGGHGGPPLQYVPWGLDQLKDPLD